MPEALQNISEYGHEPVMVEEVAGCLGPRSGGVCLDVTLGLGGHAARLMPALDGGVYIGVDRDADAIKIATERLADLSGTCELKTFNAPFGDSFFALKKAGFSAVDMVLADLGVSSMQLDQQDRGFSFRHPQADLDLRMNRDEGEPVYKKIRNTEHSDLVRLLRDYGEVEQADRLVSLILDNKPRTTGDLADLAGEVYWGPKKNKFMAKVFQAFRIWVNDEMGQLASLLKHIPKMVYEGARVVFLSYHSLEDRMVKRAFQEWEGRCSCPSDLPICQCGFQSLGQRINRGVVRASQEEIEKNPRSRSALLRGFTFKEGQHGA